MYVNYTDTTDSTTEATFYVYNYSSGALLHSEVTEILEGYRNDDHANVIEEIADTFIRLFDLCSNINHYDIETSIADKLRKNLKRGIKHGGKKV